MKEDFVKKEQYISIKEINETFEISPVLCRKILGKFIPQSEKKRINGEIVYPKLHQVVKNLIEFGKGGMISKTSLKQEFKLSDKVADDINHYEVQNPNYRDAHPMKLYFRDEVVTYLLKNVVK